MEEDARAPANAFGARVSECVRKRETSATCTERETARGLNRRVAVFGD